MSDPIWCPRCKKDTLQENLVPPFGGWCPCGFTVPDCNKPSEYSWHVARELGLPDRAISVHAPWAWALMYGGKGVENRTNGRFSKKVTGRVWIHASKGPGWGGFNGIKRKAESMLEVLWKDLGWTGGEGYDPLTASDLVRRTMAKRWGAPSFPPRKENLLAMRGHIIGSVEVYGYQTPDDPPDSPWYVPGSLAVMVRDPRPLAVPVPAKGALGWWTPTADVLRELAA